MRDGHDTRPFRHDTDWFASFAVCFPEPYYLPATQMSSRRRNAVNELQRLSGRDSRSASLNGQPHRRPTNFPAPKEGRLLI